MSLRIGILSTASIVPRFIGAARAVDGCAVSALASRDAAKAREKADLWGIPKSYGSYDELIHSDEVDAVYVAVINSAHYELSKKALLAGKHVLCEKPFTLHLEEAKELFALARDRGLFIMEMQKTVFLPAAALLKSKIKAGGLGRIVMADFTSSFDSGYNSWFFDPARGGGPLYNNAGYSLELMQYLLDAAPASWTGISQNCGTGVETGFAAVIKMDDGTIISNKTSMDAVTSHNAFIYGSLGYAVLENYWKADTLTVHYNDGRASETASYPCRYELMYELEHAVECIGNGLTSSPVMTEEITLNTVKVLSGLHDIFAGF